MLRNHIRNYRLQSTFLGLLKFKWRQASFKQISGIKSLTAIASLICLFGVIGIISVINQSPSINDDNSRKLQSAEDIQPQLAKLRAAIIEFDHGHANYDDKTMQLLNSIMQRALAELRTAKSQRNISIDYDNLEKQASDRLRSHQPTSTAKPPSLPQPLTVPSLEEIPETVECPICFGDITNDDDHIIVHHDTNQPHCKTHVHKQCMKDHCRLHRHHRTSAGEPTCPFCKQKLELQEYEGRRG